MHAISLGVLLWHFTNRPTDSVLLLYVFLITDIKASIPHNLLHGKVKKLVFDNKHNKGWGQQHHAQNNCQEVKRFGFPV